MDEYLIDLINRMNDTSDRNMEAGYDSSKTISWKALREAEKLENVDYVPQLIKYIDKEKKKENRREAYFILGHLTKNTNDKEGVQFLIDQIDKEKDKYIISSLLDRISYLEKPSGTNIDPILNAVKSDKWLIRHSAIPALKRTESKNAEIALIEVLKSSTDFHDLSYANSTLSNIGTNDSIPHLQGLLSHKKQDVACSALYAIIKIGGKDYIDLYREYLSTGKLKSYAISGVVEYGNESDISLIEKRIKELVSKKRKTEFLIEKNKTEVIIGLEFLNRFDSNKDKYNDFVNWLINKKSDKLWDTELNWIKK